MEFTMRRRVLMLGLAVQCACAGSSEVTGVTQDRAVASVELVDGLVAVGGTIPRRIRIRYTDGGEATATTGGTWTSLQPAVATVSPEGVVRGLAAGGAGIKVVYRGKEASASVSVADLVFTELSTGSRHVCGRVVSGETYCWGQTWVSNGASETCLDNGQTTALPCTYTPQPLPQGSGLRSLVAGFASTCALDADGAARCWGNNTYFQLGTATTAVCGGLPCSPTPVPVDGGHRFTQLVAGTVHACGLDLAGQAWCWGTNRVGSLGGAATDTCQDAPCSRVPIAAAGALRFVALAAGGEHTCGLTAGGAAWCWGNNNFGQLGGGVPGNSTPAVAVAGGQNFARLAAGPNSTCGLEADGTAWCWGRNDFGQIGDGSAADRDVPVRVGGGVKFTSLALGNQHSCGIATDGGAWCWGNNLNTFGNGTQTGGQLGTGNTSASLVPVKVAGSVAFSTLSTRRFTTCGVSTAGRAYCWGDNEAGELGLGDPALMYKASPTGVGGLP